MIAAELTRDFNWHKPCSHQYCGLQGTFDPAVVLGPPETGNVRSPTSLSFRTQYASTSGREGSERDRCIGTSIQLHPQRSNSTFLTTSGLDSPQLESSSSVSEGHFSFTDITPRTCLLCYSMSNQADLWNHKVYTTKPVPHITACSGRQWPESPPDPAAVLDTAVAGMSHREWTIRGAEAVPDPAVPDPDAGLDPPCS